MTNRRAVSAPQRMTDPGLCEGAASPGYGLGHTANIDLIDAFIKNNSKPICTADHQLYLRFL